MTERKIPATMSTQHPDNATLPKWCTSTVIEDDDEIYEAYFVYSELGCQEVMWDSEGKDVDTHVVRKLLEKYSEFFSEHQLGKDIFLTYRIPNPKVETAERKVVVETLYSIPLAHDVAFSFYGKEISPVFEVILPLTTDAKELLWLYNYYRNAIATLEGVFLDDKSRVMDWVGHFHPKHIEVIPLVEDFDSILAIDKIIEPYIRTVKPKYLRVFIARSDPALSYGLLCAVLLAKFGLSRLKSVEGKLNIDIYPILGVGSKPFRGHLSPDNVDAFLREYRGLSTVTIQSALKYDYPLAQVKECVNTLNKRLPNDEPIEVEPSEEEEFIALLHKARKCYERLVEELSHLINSVASYVPPRRARKLHIGLFGYARKVGRVTLPRAIPFAAALYTLGVPPEFLGGMIFEQLGENEWRLIEKHYVNLKHDLSVAGGYVSWRNLELLKDNCKRVAKRAGTSTEKLRNILNEISRDLEIVEKTLGVKLGPKSSAERKHENFVNNFLISYIEGDRTSASAFLLEAAKIRRCLG